RGGAARGPAVAQGRRVSQSRRHRRRGRGERSSAAPDGGRRDRQSGEGRRGAGDSEHERHARSARDGGAHVLSTRVVKLGGKELDRPAWLAACARALVRLDPVVVVHGGGRAVTALSRRLGLPVEKRDGRRVTTADAAAAVAGALRAAELLLVSDVPGVEVDGAVRPALEAGDVESLIELGVAADGMAAKLRAATAALRAGARAVRIGDLRLLDDARA